MTALICQLANFRQYISHSSPTTNRLLFSKKGFLPISNTYTGPHSKRERAEEREREREKGKEREGERGIGRERRKGVDTLRNPLFT